MLLSASAGEEPDDSVAKGNKRTTRSRKDEWKQMLEDSSFSFFSLFFSFFFVLSRKRDKEEDRFHLA